MMLEQKDKGNGEKQPVKRFQNWLDRLVPRKQRKLTLLFVNTIYNIVTWVIVAVTIAFFVGFFFLGNVTAYIWSFVFLVIEALFIITVNVYQHFWSEVLEPSITLDIGDTLDAYHPLETRFILTNRSAESIYNITYFSETFDHNRPYLVFTGLDATSIPELPAHKPQSLYCDNVPAAAIYATEPPPNMIVLQIKISFTFRNTLYEETFKYFAKRNTKDIFTWFPAGQAEELKPKAKTMPSKNADTQPINTKPSVRVPEIKVSNLITSEQSVFKVVIVFLNVGDAPAVQFETLYRISIGDNETLTPQDPIVKGTMLVPQISSEYDLTIGLKRHVASRIEQGEDALRIFGVIEYWDFMEERYEEHFCFEYIPKSGRFSVCPNGEEQSYSKRLREPPSPGRANVQLYRLSCQAPLRVGNPEMNGIIEFINKGGTIATDVHIRYKLQLCPSEKYLDRSFPRHIGPMPKEAVIAPERNGQMIFTCPLNDEIIRWIDAGELKVYMHGLVTYRDIFLDLRETWYCLEYIPGTVTFTPTADGNYAT